MIKLPVKYVHITESIYDADEAFLFCVMDTDLTDDELKELGLEVAQRLNDSAKVDRLTSRGFEDLHHENGELRDLLRQFNLLFATHFTEGKPIKELISEDDLLELLRKTRQAIDGGNDE